MERFVSIVAACGLAVASCGGGTTPSGATGPPVTEAPTATAEPAPTVAPAPEPTAPPATVPPTTSAPGPAGSLEEIRSAVVRIVGTGSFADPAGGVQANVPGSGTGFVIDPSGLAVTNNHVVTGAAFLEVYVGDDATPRNAHVVGVSECSDLAVIDIDGDGFDFLGWHDGPIAAGMPIFAAGFPLGDAEYTVLDGIVSKENAAGDSSWASVDSVVEHSADTLPGNSGGPIVTGDGAVVGVNYAGNEAGQSFAIGVDAARPIVEVLRSGADHESIGVNGEVVGFGDSTGIWVASVESGSPADVTGIVAGDLITALEGITLGLDGTMAGYCDVLRSHLPTDTLSVEVYRQRTDELLGGQINGRPLEVLVSFETQFDEVVADDPSGVPYTDYMLVTDDSALIEVSVPVQWSDIDGRLWDSDLVAGSELIGPALTASPDVAAFVQAWGTPGVFIGASALIGLTIEEVLDSYWFGDACTYDGRFPYDDGLYTGLYDVYTNCGPEGSVFFQAVVEPADRTWIASVQIIAVTDADLEAADNVFASFTVAALGG